MTALPRVGVLALQGDVREHLRMLAEVGADPRIVRTPEDLAAVDALVIPGGESTAILRLARAFEVLEPIRERIADGLATFGTCAGMIMLADRLADGAEGQETFGGLDATVRRNAFGRQVDSFEAYLDFAGLDEPLHAVFIRAPAVEDVGPGVEVLARLGPDGGAGRIVAVRQGRVMATSFHPEIAGDARVHRLLVDLVDG